MPDHDIPEWAEAAIDEMAPAFDDWRTNKSETCEHYRALVERIIARWGEIRADVLPSLAALPPNEQQAVLAQALFAGKFWAQAEGKKLREAKRQIQNLSCSIQLKAAELAELLCQRSTLAEAHAISGADFDFSDVLASAAASYEAWAKTCNFDHLLRAMRVTSQPSPSLSDLVAAIAAACSTSESGSTQFDHIIASRKSDADSIRALIGAVAKVASYRPGDRALAVLASVLFDQEVDTDQLKMIRTRQSNDSQPDASLNRYCLNPPNH